MQKITTQTILLSPPNPDIRIDQQGRITLAANGTAPPIIALGVFVQRSQSVPSDGFPPGDSFVGATITPLGNTVVLSMSYRKQQVASGLFEHTLRANVRCEGFGDFSGINTPGLTTIVVDASVDPFGLNWQANPFFATTPEQSVGASSYVAGAPTFASQPGARFFCNWTGAQQLTITSSWLLSLQILQSDDFLFTYYTVT